MEELLLTAATALVTRATNSLTGEGLKALDALRRAVAAKFSRRPALDKALESAREQPDDKGRVRNLADALGLAAGTDPEFAETLATLVPRIVVQVQIQDNRTDVSLVSGPMSGGINIQTGVVHGDMTVHQPGGEQGRADLT